MTKEKCVVCGYSKDAAIHTSKHLNGMILDGCMHKPFHDFIFPSDPLIFGHENAKQQNKLQPNDLETGEANHTEG